MYMYGYASLLKVLHACTCDWLAWTVNCAFVYLDGCGNVQNPDISHNTLSVLIFDPSSLEVSQILGAKDM